jgi:hypothetical protein
VAIGEINAMSDVEVTFKLPEELVERARAAGIEIETVTPDIVKLIEARIQRKEAWQRLSDAAQLLEGSLTPEEIEAELAAAKAERIAPDQAK